MMLNEFKKRVEKFIPAESVERYAEDYEPAYMSLTTIDKDDFCAVLKDDVVRQMVIEFAHNTTAYCNEVKELDKKLTEERERTRIERERGEAKIAFLEGCIDALKKKLSLIQSVCDRALAPNN